MKIKIGHFLIFLLLIVLNSCSIEDDPTPVEQEQQGVSGSFTFNSTSSALEKSIPILYYLPKNKNKSSKVVFVLHGAGRNAGDYRDAWKQKADQYNLIIITPVFTESNFPGGDAYNLGNVYIDGDNPSPSSLNTSDKWAFSYIEPLFDFVKDQYDNSTTNYAIFGHSAGGQFVHRFMMFGDNLRFDKAVISASGWYTAFDKSINFPYGISNCILEDKSFSPILSKKFFIQVGENDTDENNSGLRHNQHADNQGMNRYDRANYFFDTTKSFAQFNSINFNWELHTILNRGHDFAPACSFAADLMFN